MPTDLPDPSKRVPDKEEPNAFVRFSLDFVALLLVGANIISTIAIANVILMDYRSLLLGILVGVWTYICGVIVRVSLMASIRQFIIGAPPEEK